MNTVLEIDSLIQQLTLRKQELIKEQVENLHQAIESEFAERWATFEQEESNKFNTKLEKVKSLLCLEYGILEALKTYVPDEMLFDIQDALVRCRKYGDCSQFSGVYSKYARDNVVMRQILKLVTAVYRYNYTLIHHKTRCGSSASRIKYATLCPHCGEMAKEILLTMSQTQFITLP